MTGSADTVGADGCVFGFAVSIALLATVLMVVVGGSDDDGAVVVLFPVVAMIIN